MASTQQHSSPSGNGSLEAPPVQDSVEVKTTRLTAREALSTTAFIVYVCVTMGYIFLSAQVGGEDKHRFNIARLVVLVVWMVNSGVLFLCHARYLIQHKREIASAFFVSAVGMPFLEGSGGTAITDGIGVVMLCIIIAALCPGLRGASG